jgi:hypothetical protein
MALHSCGKTMYTWTVFKRLFFDDFEVRGEFARRLHSLWLTKALRVGVSMPRIPTRLVREGGFDTVVNTPAGREWADRWWNEALQTPDPT